MTVRLIRGTGLYSAPYAYASVAMAPSNGLIFTAGAGPLDQDGYVTGSGDIEAQTRQAMANLTSTLHAAGADLADVLKTTIYVASTERTDLTAVSDVVRTIFGDHDVPSTLLGVTVLGYPGQLVEIEAVATASRSRPSTAN